MFMHFPKDFTTNSCLSPHNHESGEWVPPRPLFLLQCNGTVGGRNPANQLRLVVFPIIFKVLQCFTHPSAGLLPSINSISIIFHCAILTHKMIQCSWVTTGLGITPRYTPWNQRFCQQFMWAFLDVWAIHKWISSPKTYLRFRNYDELPSEVSDMRSHLTIFDSILTPSCAQRGSPWDFRGTFAKRTGPLLGRDFDASMMYGVSAIFATEPAL